MLEFHGLGEASISHLGRYRSVETGVERTDGYVEGNLDGVGFAANMREGD